MARPLRIEFTHGLYHVTSRGDGREDIYRGDADRELFLVVLSETVDRFNWVIHAYWPNCGWQKEGPDPLSPCENEPRIHLLFDMRGAAV